ncbi:MAG TPA: DUF3710 domain-containing protein [Beutenbergiaceae bacterium]|nr:DUF3710 domain-containing protein [Beutenbergiaceae bacterium]
MRLFKRKGSRGQTEKVIGPEPGDVGYADPVTDEEVAADPPAVGPWDEAQAPEDDQRIDLGAVRLPKRPGMQVRMELDKKTRRVIAVNVALDGSSLQVQAFAAPRSEGLWSDLREEIVASIKKQGGTAQERTGGFGVELLARLPVRMPDGRSGTRPARFLGVDGPRWFLRGVLTGKAAVEDDAAEQMESVFSEIVVVRGGDARPPRDLLTLHLPGKAPGAEESAQDRPSIELPKRGPEITEVR